MSASLSDLATQLQADIPAYASVPTTDQYSQAVVDAVADLARRLPYQRVTTIAVVDGTDSYELPADFVRLIRFAGPPLVNNVIVTDQGLIPGPPWADTWSNVGQLAPMSPMAFSEQITVQGLTLQIFPTPRYRIERTLWYAAGDVLDDDGDTYSTMQPERAQIAMLKARAICLSLQAAKAARDAFISELGPEKGDKTKQSAAFKLAADDTERQYVARVAAQTGPYGSRATWPY